MRFIYIKLTLILFLLLLNINRVEENKLWRLRAPASLQQEACHQVVAKVVNTADELADQSHVEKALGELVNGRASGERVEKALGMNRYGVFDESALSYSQLEPTEVSPLTFREKAPVENLLKQTDIDDMKYLGDGANRSYLITYEDGVQAIWKPYEKEWNSNYKAEVLAYEIDQLLGLNLVPPTVARTIDDEIGSVQLFIAPAKGEFTVSSSDLYKQDFLDFILDNRDRVVSYSKGSHEKHVFYTYDHNSYLHNCHVSADDHRLISFDNGDSFTGMGYHGKSFAFSQNSITEFLGTEDGKRVLTKLQGLDYDLFRTEVTRYLGEKDTSLLIRRMKFISLLFK